MKPIAALLSVFILGGFNAAMSAQTFAQGSDKSAVQLETLSKKIDEQNTKIDALSQQLLKLEQQLATQRPGIMIGESTPAPTASTTASASSAAAVANGNAHIVTKGETLTSIAKTHKVGVQELQKFNHIENDRALQIGQTIMIPPAAGAPVASPTPAAPNE
ncbi:MAG: LysM peptidoglycan-binding domain-containing protein [Verrucomicrobiota bacterium]|nr:LysM peptidoglycan-binding domain-containing protein [Verrucomicrobiota bacterium]